MAKITLDMITNSRTDYALINTNFQEIASQLNDLVLYRNNPAPEPNQMFNLLDMNSNEIINATTVSATDILLNGTPINDTLTTAVDAAEASATAAALSETNAATSETNAAASAVASSDSAAESAASAAQAAGLLSAGANQGKNLLINGDFSVNQREVTGSVALAAGEYGHDRFKAGASGCTYTFATLNGVTTLTISAGTLLQIVEGTSLASNDVVLSWEGTAQGRIDSGTYGTSGTVTATTTGGVNTTVEFDTGTLSNTQLEIGTVSTDFEHVSPADQFNRCLRYFERRTVLQDGMLGCFAGFGGTSIQGGYTYYPKRAIPIVTIEDGWATFQGNGLASLITLSTADETTTGCTIDGTGGTGMSGGIATPLRALNANRTIDVDAEL